MQVDHFALPEDEGAWEFLAGVQIVWVEGHLDVQGFTDQVSAAVVPVWGASGFGNVGDLKGDVGGWVLEDASKADDVRAQVCGYGLGETGYV